MGFVLKQAPLSGLIAICVPQLLWEPEAAKSNQMDKVYLDKIRYKVHAFDLEGHPRSIGFEIIADHKDSYPVLRSFTVMTAVEPFPAMVQSALTMTLDRIKDLTPMGVKDQATNMTYSQGVLTTPALLTRRINRDLKLVKGLLRGILTEGFGFSVGGSRI